MTWHADYTFGRKHQGGRPNFIAAGVTTAAELIFLRHLHPVKRADPVRIAGSAPGYASILWISYRIYADKVTGPAGHGGMQIVVHLFVMGPMALTAFARCLIAVFELCGLWVTD